MTPDQANVDELEAAAKDAFFRLKDAAKQYAAHHYEGWHVRVTVLVGGEGIEFGSRGHPKTDAK